MLITPTTFSSTGGNLWGFRNSQSGNALTLDRKWANVWNEAVSVNRASGDVSLAGDLGVGIGTPTTELDIRGGSYAPNQEVGLNIGVPFVAGWMSGMYLRSDSGGVPRVGFDVMTTGSGDTKEIISLSSFGRVGIGTGTGLVAGVLEIAEDDNPGIPSLYLSQIRPGATTSDIAIAGGAVIRSGTGQNYVGGGSGSYFRWLVDSNDVGGVTDGTTGATEMMRLNSAGNLGIGVTGPGKTVGCCLRHSV